MWSSVQLLCPAKLFRKHSEPAYKSVHHQAEIWAASLWCLFSILCLFFSCSLLIYFPPLVRRSPEVQVGQTINVKKLFCHQLVEGKPCPKLPFASFPQAKSQHIVSVEPFLCHSRSEGLWFFIKIPGSIATVPSFYEGFVNLLEGKAGYSQFCSELS